MPHQASDRNATSLEHSRQSRSLIRGHRYVGIAAMPIPPLQDDQFLLSIEWAGVCGTDLQIMKGLRVERARVLGHEGCARVNKIGSSLTDHLSFGERVIVNPTCYGRPELLLGHNIDGLMQTDVVLPGSLVEEGMVLPLPRDFPGVLSTLIEPLATALYALEICRGTAGNVVVFGAGIVGHLLALELLRRTPLTQVTLVHRDVTSILSSPILAIPEIKHVLVSEIVCDQAAFANTYFERAFVTTPRTATIGAVDTLIPLMVAGGGIHLIAGLSPHDRSLWCQNVDLSEVRGQNWAGLPWPPQRHVVHVKHPTRQTNVPIMLSGHRGVSTEYLKRAIDVLRGDPQRFALTITHRMDIDKAAHCLTHYLQTGQRHADGARFLKIAIRFGSKNEGEQYVDPSTP